MSSRLWCRALIVCAIAIGLTAQEALAQRAAPAQAAVPLRDARGSGNHTALRAAADYFLDINGVDGESEPAGEPQRDQIEIESWSWGETARRIFSRNSGGGSVVIEVLAHDAASPGSGRASGRRDPAATAPPIGFRKGDALGTLMLEAYTNGHGEAGWVRYMLHGVRVSSVAAGTRNGRRVEKITMSYERVTLQRSGRTPSGVAPASPSRAGA